MSQSPVHCRRIRSFAMKGKRSMQRDEASERNVHVERVE
jgi:hypothetical protein